MNHKSCHFHETPLVAQVLMAAAENLIRRGEMLWSSSEVNEVAIQEHVRAGSICGWIAGMEGPSGCLFTNASAFDATVKSK